ncbi:sulfotransferase family protein [Candidatus Harpocratesius sp.]
MRWEEILPNFLIVGAMKSGTSTLAFQLGQHPDIFMADRELHFFDDEVSYSKGIKFYEHEFRNWQNEKKIGEKTPAYCLKLEYAKRIATHLPSVKLIWIFRNPVERTYSEYWHAFRKGAETQNFKDSILDKNGEILNPEKCRYIERSLYYKHVEFFLKYLSKENMYFTTFEKFISSPIQITQEIFKFLGVNPNFQIDPSVKKNVTVIPKSVKIQKIFDKLGNFGKKIVKSDGIIADFYRKIVKINQKNDFKYPLMSLDIKSKLQKYYLEYNKKLIQLTGLEIDEWNIQ